MYQDSTDTDTCQESNLTVEKQKFYSPGARICRKQKNIVPLSGTYQESDYICASRPGFLTISQETLNDKTVEQLSIIDPRFNSLEPKFNDDVLARVCKIMNRRVECEILFINDIPTSGSFKGFIRIQDIREFETDKIRILDCFRLMDVVKAKIIGHDSRKFILSTSGEEYGVVSGTSNYGGNLIPIAWNFMRCCKTGSLEYRKTARAEKPQQPKVPLTEE